MRKQRKIPHSFLTMKAYYSILKKNEIHNRYLTFLSNFVAIKLKVYYIPHSKANHFCRCHLHFSANWNLSILSTAQSLPAYLCFPTPFFRSSFSLPLHLISAPTNGCWCVFLNLYWLANHCSASFTS